MAGPKLFLKMALAATLTAAVLITAACASLPPVFQTPATPPPAGAPLPTPTPWLPFQAVQLAAAGQLGVAPAVVTLVSSEPAEWRDGCLGLARPGEMCTQVIIPGYKIVVAVAGQQYEFHTNESGSQVRAAHLPAAGAATDPAQRVRAALAQQLGLASEAISVVSVEPIEWPDACLGAPQPDEVCAQVVTPGYRIVLEAQGIRYEYHVDETGQIAREIAVATGLPAVIEWRRVTTNSCAVARITADTVASGPCDGELKTVKLATKTNRPAQLAEMRQLYHSFAADTPAGEVALAGEGSLYPTPAEQRMVAEWTTQVIQEASGEEGLALWGLGWRREGGIAGFCDDLAIDTSGYARLSSCKDAQPANLGSRRLTADELAQFYGWLDAFAPFEFTQTDPAQADALTIRYVFAGRGSGQPSDADKQAVAAFGAQVLAAWPDRTPAGQTQTPGKVALGPAAETTGAYP